MHSQVWDKITNPFPNFNEAIVEVWDWISNFIPLYDGCNYLSMLGLKLNHGGKRAPARWDRHIGEKGAY